MKLGKRGKNKIGNRTNYSNKATYNQFILKYPELNITYEEYFNIIKKSNQAINYYILNNELGFKLPRNLGYVAVNKFKQQSRYRVIDWKNSLKYGKEIPLLNLHSFGNMYKIDIFKNKRLNALRAYKFNAHRTLKRALAQKIKEGKDYFSIDKNFFSKRMDIDNYLKDI